MKTGLSMIVALVMMILSVSLSAQTTGKYAAEADVEYLNQGYNEAISLYKVAIKRTKDLEEKATILFRVGESYRKLNQLDQAAEYFDKSVTAQYWKFDPEVYLNLGDVYAQQGKMPEAIEQFNKYIEKGGDSGMAESRIAEAEKAVRQMEEPASRYVVDQEILLNTEYHDFTPLYSNKKGDEIVLSSSRPSAAGNENDPKSGQNFMDIYAAKRDRKGKWSTPTPVNSTVNSLQNESVSAFTPDYKTMYFTRCSDPDPEVRGACELCYAEKQGKKYGPSQMVPLMDRVAESDDSTNFGHPAIAPEGNFMIIASDIAGGFGGLDLYSLELDKDGKVVGTLKNLGKNFNTAGDEAFPYIRSSGELYYASTGMEGLGGMDLYVCAKTGEMSWDRPENMGYPINTPSDDFGIIYEKDADQGLFTSNRPGGKGLDDIYSFKNPPLEFCLQGVAYNDETGVTLNNVNIVVTGSDGKSFDLTTDDNGGFSLCDGELTAETNYTVVASKTNYLGTKDEFSLVGLTESTTLAREYFLIEVSNKPIQMPEIRYVFDSPKLLVDNEINSPDSLNFLLDVLNTNPNIVVNLEAHSDTRGGADYNKVLSQKRAQSVVDYLVSKGIPSDRMIPVGKGEEEPIISDAEIGKLKTEAEIEAAHAKNRRTVFSIARTDYKPK